MRLRWTEWIWRNKKKPVLGLCRSCETPLELCKICKGDWRAHSCRHCQLGLVCIEHRNQWI